MNVTVRTYDEVRSNRVSIEVAAGERLEITVDGSASELAHKRLFTGDEVIAAQATEGELIGNALRADLERERQIARDLRAQAYEQNDRAAELRQQIKELGDRHRRELKTERLKWERVNAERRDAVNGRDLARGSLIDARRELDKLKRQIQDARELLTADEVAQARRMCMGDIASTMGHAIGAALRVIDQA